MINIIRKLRGARAALLAAAVALIAGPAIAGTVTMTLIFTAPASGPPNCVASPAASFVITVPAGTVLATCTATGVPAGTPEVWSLTQPTAGQFAISGSGVLTAAVPVTAAGSIPVSIATSP